MSSWTARRRSTGSPNAPPPRPRTVPSSSSFPRPSSRARRSGSTRSRSGTATRTGSACSPRTRSSIPGPATDRLGAIAREHGVWLAIGVQEKEPHGGTIYNTFLYLSPDGRIADKHRKLVPTGSERTVWGMGDGSTLRVVETPFGRIGGLICWENYMPLARFHLYAQGIDVWLAPTLAPGDAWIATMRHLARENRMFVVGVNPVLHVDSIPDDFPDRDRLVPGPLRGGKGPWLEEGNSVIVGPGGEILAGPSREREETLIADLDVGAVAAARRVLDPVGHYNRPGCVPAACRHDAAAACR